MKQKQAHLSRLGTGLFSFLCIVYVLPGALPAAQ